MDIIFDALQWTADYIDHCNKECDKLIRILLALPPDLKGKNDDAAALAGMSRSACIRESIRRNVRFFDKHERNTYEKMRNQAYS